MKRLILVLITVMLLVGGIAVYSVFAPYQRSAEEVFLDFPKGTTTRAMAKQLADAGVIRYPWQFLVVRALRPAAKLQAGEYRFQQPDSVDNIFRRISRGDVFYYEFTMPEGSNVFDVATAVEKLGVIHGKDFLKAASNGSLISDLAPGATSLEGYLFPSTYRLTRRTTAEQLAKQMVDEFRKQWKVASGTSSANVHEVVTLASLVEKETGVGSERPLVASVYHNRLKMGMKLDCDPTTIYAALLQERYTGVIHRSDLDSTHPYNTYQHAGLPPGPIANPGLASLKAALAPAESDYIYFVAKPDGSGAHSFSSNYAAHERAVAEYRRGHAKATPAR